MAESAFAVADLDRLYTDRYPEYSREHFDQFIAWCERYNFDPFDNEVYFDTRHDIRRKRAMMVVILGIRGYRRVAHATGLYAGCDPTEFHYADGDSRNPATASVTVYRLVGGTRQPFVGEVAWDEIAPEPGSDWYWDTRPRDCMERAAEAKALRRAFPETLGGVITPEEMPREKATPKSAAVRGSAQAGAMPTEDDGPTTRMQFEMQMMELGHKDQARRNDVIGRLKARFASLYEADEPTFWSRAWAELRRRPKEYEGSGTE